jgi:transposase
MRQIRDILRLYWEQRLTMRQIAQSAGVGLSSVSDRIHRAEAAGLGWPLAPDLDDLILERLLYPGAQGRPHTDRVEPDWATIDAELRRKGVTLELLWIEYKREHPEGYQYSWFCARYRRWQQRVDPVLRQLYQAGEKLFVDYAGQTVPILDPRTGEVHDAVLFVAVLGASNYTYAELQWAPDLPSWIGGHTRALEFFGGAPALVVPDNLKAGVTTASWYEPELNPTYAEWAAHYGTAILPARPRHPRDRAKVEVGVQIVERWILAVLRHRTFTSLAEANAAIRALLERLNARPFKKRPGSRHALFEMLDRPALRPLPQTPYEFAQWKQAKVSIDYHVAVAGDYYSVPYQLIGERVDIRLTAHTIEAFRGGRRIASHARGPGRGEYVTDPHHRPSAHQRYLEWSPSRLIGWATDVGPQTARLVETILRERPHPEQGYRACLGILRLGKHYPPARVEAAAARALAIHAHSYRSFKSILERGLDQLALELEPRTAPRAPHVHVRGPRYFTDDGRTH